MMNDGHDNYDQDGWALTQQFLSEENLRGSDEAVHYKSFLQNEPGQALSIDTEGAAGSSMHAASTASSGAAAISYGTGLSGSEQAGVSLNSSAGQQAALSTSGEHAPQFGAAEPVSSNVSSEDGWQAGAKETQHMLNWFYGMHD
ncbi:hypothetical protein [Paenibacillus agilis]|uniref:Uncharacterized protein n=1 Tax=Paenibacillus agilis TaxID=3020863 RepID=A0A559IGT4_9BACL|nr:hypothetical protein [Paenibacillus agilis]TVX86887.1 hypothetical protein FPZ44_23555 [Paenibacillus agilis]